MLHLINGCVNIKMPKERGYKNMAFRRWAPSKAQKRAFAQKMDEVLEYCKANEISCSASMDSFYFFIGDQSYRVSNHSVESSKWHDGRKKDVKYIHASKTRLIEIHQALLKGLKLNGRGEVIHND